MAGLVWETVGTIWTKTYVYLPSASLGTSGRQLLAQYSNSTTYFVHKDHLGSSRVLTRVDKSVHEAYDYLPYGESSGCTGLTSSSHCFTGKERDAESGLDNFGARYFASSVARFTSTDPQVPGGGHLANPQKWNKYTYVLNNPLIYFDANGLQEASFHHAMSKIVSAFKVKVEAGVGVEYGGHIGTAKGKVGAAVKGEVSVSSNGLSVKAVAEGGFKVNTPIGSVGATPGAEVQTIKDGKGIPLKDQKIELKTDVTSGGEKTEAKGSTSGEVGVGLTVSAGGGVAGADVSVNTKDVTEGFGELAVAIQQKILQAAFPGAMPAGSTQNPANTSPAGDKCSDGVSKPPPKRE